MSNEVVHSNTRTLTQDSPRRKKLKSQNVKLKNQVRALQQRIRRLQDTRKKRQKKETEASEEFEVLRQ